MFSCCGQVFLEIFSGLLAYSEDHDNETLVSWRFGTVCPLVYRLNSIDYPKELPLLSLLHSPPLFHSSTLLHSFTPLSFPRDLSALKVWQNCLQVDHCEEDMASVETFHSIADNKAGPVDPGDAMRFWLIVKGTLWRNHKKLILRLMNESCMYAVICLLCVHYFSIIISLIWSHNYVFRWWTHGKRMQCDGDVSFAVGYWNHAAS